jgi:hypothetical protein
VPSTPLHHKPIFYGSPAADAAFWLLVVLHIVPAMIAPIAAIVAFASKKGERLHLAAGKYFTRSMYAVALTGIVLDVVRLSFFVKENHTKYMGYSMPSTYPARLGFLYAALCVLYMLRESAPPAVFRPNAGLNPWVPRVLLGLGIAFTLLIVAVYNPWTGALWMIVTFMLLVHLVARGRASLTERSAGVAHHRFGMAFLAAFSWWGALQGFGPAIQGAIKGPDMSTAPYLGNQPGGFDIRIVGFLVPWLPMFVLGAYFVRRFRLRARENAQKA